MKYVIEGKMCSIPQPGAESLEQRIERLEARSDIMEILFHYTRCVDRGDAAGVASCYTEDGCFYPGDNMPGIQGKDRIFRLFTRCWNQACRPAPTTSAISSSASSPGGGSGLRLLPLLQDLQRRAAGGKLLGRV